MVEQLPADNAVPAWRAVREGEILWATWSGDYIAYHRPSGKTHLVNAPTFVLLTDVLREPKSARAAAAELAAAQEASADAAFSAQVAALLERLEQLGLVERRDA